MHKSAEERKREKKKRKMKHAKEWQRAEERNDGGDR